MWFKTSFMSDTSISSSYVLQGFHPAADQTLIHRLLDLGLYPGVEFEIVRQLSFSQVVIVRFHQTILALNEQEYLCLII